MSASPALEGTRGDALFPPSESPRRFDLRDVDWRAVFAHPLTIPSLLVFAGLILAFWPMIAALPERWTEDEYYSHGWLVPFLAGFIVFRRWPKIAAYASRPNLSSGAGVAVRLPVAVALVAAPWVAAFGLFRSGVLDTGIGGSASYTSGLLPLFLGFIVLMAVYGIGIFFANKVLGPAWTAAAGLIALFPLMYVSYLGHIIVVQSLLFVVAATLAVVLVAGWRWGFALFPAFAYLLFAFPVWNSFIDGYTNPLQLASTKVAFQLLKATGFSPLQTDPTTIYLNNFQLNVAVPCSGMKLMLAVSAFTTLFILIANLRFWSNLFMVGLIIPLCLFVNGLRIALIGMVGNEYGQAAGMQFHDYSGYITLVVCFFLLFKFARLLGWKD